MSLISSKKKSLILLNNMLYGAVTNNPPTDSNKDYIITPDLTYKPSISFISDSFNNAISLLNITSDKFITGYESSKQYAISVINGKLASSKILDVKNTIKEVNGTVEGFIEIHKLNPTIKEVLTEEIQYTLNKFIADTIEHITSGYIPSNSVNTSDPSGYINITVSTESGAVKDVSVSTKNIANTAQISLLLTNQTSIANRVTTLEKVDNTTNIEKLESIVHGANLDTVKHGDISNNLYFNVVQGVKGAITDVFITVNYALLTGSTILYGIATSDYVTDHYNYKWNSSIIPVVDNINASISRINTSIGIINSSIKNINSSITNIKSDLAALTTKVNNNTSNIASNASNIAINKSNIADLSTLINNSQSNIDSLITLVNTNKSNISSLTTTVSNHTSTLNTYYSYITSNESNISSLDSRVTALENSGVGSPGESGADGAAAGFDTPEATIGTNNPDNPPSVSVTASGPNTNKKFKFVFNNIRGKDGTNGTGDGTSVTYSEATSSTLGLVKIGYNGGNNNIGTTNIKCPVKLSNGQMYIELSTTDILSIISFTPVFLEIS